MLAPIMPVIHLAGIALALSGCWRARKQPDAWATGMIAAGVFFGVV